ncbi:MAG: prepilin-type N-terminal cleavage/methylation domain-containing protein [Candidatus Babeliaceae bacterium]|nr:prepilin-type N-terminal cleavage/methylation domain-containing protein [Candidatus Babeliaceae bacterium]
MMRPGFSLIEIIIALAISGFVGIMVFNTVWLLQQSSKRYNELITVDSQQQILFSQMQKDISSMVVPLYGFLANANEKKEEQEKVQQEYFKRFGLQIEIENEKFKSLSFVTTTVLGIYGAKKPRLVRVRYLMVPDTNHKNYFTLMRQESSELLMSDFERSVAENKNFSHTIAFGIKTSSISCTSIAMNENEKKVEEVSSWSFTELSKKQQQPNARGKIEQPIALPQIITCNGVMGDFTSDHEHPFSYSFFIPVDPKIKSQILENKEPAKQEDSAKQTPTTGAISPKGAKRIFEIAEKSPALQTYPARAGNQVAGGPK